MATSCFISIVDMIIALHEIATGRIVQYISTCYGLSFEYDVQSLLILVVGNRQPSAGTLMLSQQNKVSSSGGPRSVI